MEKQELAKPHAPQQLGILLLIPPHRPAYWFVQLATLETEQLPQLAYVQRLVLLPSTQIPRLEIALQSALLRCWPIQALKVA